ncbi:hypothetical protein PCANC_03826 [Puccinia coronata f. sp. avenae]|uniref:Uncharacterized protein n=1 Tax=Puccinia coronata f. sp. avenae TaxID=200324 RepID=A0A2N5T7D6_9BASI|nr:hypothetical protein PCANC_03826 [Puccinia coronata f. sp. avenae]
MGNQKKSQPKESSSLTAATPPTASSSISKKAKAKTPKGSGYCGSNYNPKHQSRYNELESADKERGKQPYPTVRAKTFETRETAPQMSKPETAPNVAILLARKIRRKEQLSPLALVIFKNWPTEICCKMIVEEWDKALQEANLQDTYSNVLIGFRDGFSQGIPPHTLGKEILFYTPKNHKSNPLGTVINGDGSFRPTNNLLFPHRDPDIPLKPP